MLIFFTSLPDIRRFSMATTWIKTIHRTNSGSISAAIKAPWNMLPIMTKLRAANL